VRAKLKNTLSIIEAIESKKDKRNRNGITAAQRWHLDLEQGRISGGIKDPKNALAAIEQMIEEEKKKLEIDEDDSHMGTILG
jgi:hypothetical protein